MSRPIVIFFDVDTQQSIEREMNDTEYAQYEIDKALFDQEESVRAAERAEAEALAAAKAVAKAELLAALNLSQETLDLLNGLN